MTSILETASRWTAEGTGYGRAIVVRVAGPVAFEAGAVLLAADDGRIAGSVSPGCVDGPVAEAVLAARRGVFREVIRYGVNEGQAADVEMSCGGVIHVLVEPDCPMTADPRGRVPVAVATVLPAERETPPRPRVSMDASGITSGTLGDPALDAVLAGIGTAAMGESGCRVTTVGPHELLLEVDAPARLVIVGAGEIGVHLARLAHDVGYHVTVVDSRSAFATRERFPDADELLVGWADELAGRAGIDAGAFVTAIAHDPKQDDPAILTALARGARYIGALGSRRTHATRLARLEADGSAAIDLARIHAPIGLDLGGRSAAELAVAILAEVVRERRGVAPSPVPATAG